MITNSNLKGVKPKYVVAPDPELKHMPYAEAVIRIAENTRKAKASADMQALSPEKFKEFEEFQELKRSQSGKTSTVEALKVEVKEIKEVKKVNEKPSPRDK